MTRHPCIYISVSITAAICVLYLSRFTEARLSTGLIATPHAPRGLWSRNALPSLSALSASLSDISLCLIKPSKCCLHSTISSTRGSGTPIPCNPYWICPIRTSLIELYRSILTRYTIRDLKRRERAARFAALRPEYHAPLTDFNTTIINKPIEELVEDVHNGVLSPLEVLLTYGKVAVKAHEKTNCITELLLPEAEEWATSEVNLQGPLAGIPVSLKDSIQVKGFDISLGYARLAAKPYEKDGPMVRLLKDAGK